MLCNPSFLCDFLNDYGYIDPRIAFSRASTGTYCDRNGILRTRSASNPRFTFNPMTGYPQGLRGELAFTNLATFSEDFTNAIWLKNVATITANTAVAPDGNTAADNLASTGVSGYVSQSMTIPAGQAVAASVFIQKTTSNFARLVIGLAGDQVASWYNLTTGVVASHTQVGTGTIIYGAAYMEPWPNGWYRCSLTVTTTTPTTVSLFIQAAAADSTLPANGDAMNIWGAMVSAAVGTLGQFVKVPSYVAAVAGSAVTRATDIVVINLPDPTWFDSTQGTLFSDFSIPFANGLNTAWAIGAGNTTSDYLGIQIQVAGNLGGVNNNIYGTTVAGGVTQSQPVDSGAITAFDTSIRVAMGYRQNDFTTLCVNGRPVQQSPLVVASWPAAPVRFALGSPWTTNLMGLDLRRVAYFPRKLTNAQLIDLTI